MDESKWARERIIRKCKWGNSSLQNDDDDNDDANVVVAADSFDYNALRILQSIHWHTVHDKSVMRDDKKSSECQPKEATECCKNENNF